LILSLAIISSGDPFARLLLEDLTSTGGDAISYAIFRKPGQAFEPWVQAAGDDYRGPMACDAGELPADFIARLITNYSCDTEFG
jgi:hypothetical protein